MKYMPAIALCSSLLTAVASAQAETVKTATWFADHPAEAARVKAACHDNPGQFRNDPNCINEDQSEIIVARRDAEAHYPIGLPMSDPRYWDTHPEQLPGQISLCKALPPNSEARRIYACAVSDEYLASKRTK